MVCRSPRVACVLVRRPSAPLPAASTKLRPRTQVRARVPCSLHSHSAASGRRPTAGDTMCSHGIVPLCMSLYIHTTPSVTTSVPTRLMYSFTFYGTYSPGTRASHPTKKTSQPTQDPNLTRPWGLEGRNSSTLISERRHSSLSPKPQARPSSGPS